MGKGRSRGQGLDSSILVALGLSIVCVCLVSLSLPLCSCRTVHRPGNLVVLSSMDPIYIGCHSDCRHTHTHTHTHPLPCHPIPTCPDDPANPLVFPPSQPIPRPNSTHSPTRNRYSRPSHHNLAPVPTHDLTLNLTSPNLETFDSLSLPCSIPTQISLTCHPAVPFRSSHDDCPIVKATHRNATDPTDATQRSRTARPAAHGFPLSID